MPIKNHIFKQAYMQKKGREIEGAGLDDLVDRPEVSRYKPYKPPIFDFKSLPLFQLPNWIASKEAPGSALPYGIIDRNVEKFRRWVAKRQRMEGLTDLQKELEKYPDISDEYKARRYKEYLERDGVDSATAEETAKRLVEQPIGEKTKASEDVLLNGSKKPEVKSPPTQTSVEAGEEKDPKDTPPPSERDPSESFNEQRNAYLKYKEGQPITKDEATRVSQYYARLAGLPTQNEIIDPTLQKQLDDDRRGLGGGENIMQDRRDFLNSGLMYNPGAPTTGVKQRDGSRTNPEPGIDFYNRSGNQDYRAAPIDTSAVNPAQLARSKAVESRPVPQSTYTGGDKYDPGTFTQQPGESDQAYIERTRRAVYDADNQALAQRQNQLRRQYDSIVGNPSQGIPADKEKLQVYNRAMDDLRKKHSGLAATHAQENAYADAYQKGLAQRNSLKEDKIVQPKPTQPMRPMTRRQPLPGSRYTSGKPNTSNWSGTL